LTAPHPIKPTSHSCLSAWQPNPGRGSTYRGGKSVQITETTSERYAGGVGKFRLAHLQKNSAGANLLPDVDIYGSRASAAADRRLRHVRNLPIAPQR
jgi:hypothetical protein